MAHTAVTIIGGACVNALSYTPRRACYAVVIVLGFAGSAVWAAGDGESAPGEIDAVALTMAMLGGLAIFLYGMEMMSDALKMLAGRKMKHVLAKLTTGRLGGLLTGAFVTAVIQSSSVTTVLVVGFVTAELMTLTQAIGVILGAGIGTTITAQVVAFNVTAYAKALLAIGFLLYFAGRKDSIRQGGLMLFGFGLLFFGMGEMKDAMYPLRESEAFLGLMARMDNPILAVGIAAAFTALIQSSSASIGVIIVMAGQGVLSLEAGIILSLGANIGTCATAGLAAIGKPRAAQRAALAHVLSKVLGVAIVLPFVPLLAGLVTAISPGAPEGMDALAARAAVAPRQIANAQTVFNVCLALTLLPFSASFARFLERLLPEKAQAEEETSAKVRYLDRALLNTPSLALTMVRREVGHMGSIVNEMIEGVPEAVFRGNMEQMSKLEEMDEQVDELHEAVTSYLSDVGAENMDDETSDEALNAMKISSEIEAIGDVVETNLRHLAQQVVDYPESITPEIMKDLTEYHAMVLHAFTTVVTSFVRDDPSAATVVVGMKEEIAGFHHASRQRLGAQLRAEDGRNNVSNYILHMNVMDNLKRIFYHTKRIAKCLDAGAIPKDE